MAPGHADILLYGYTGSKTEHAKLFVDLQRLDIDAEGLYFDLFYPFRMLEFLGNESTERARVLDTLWHAVLLLDLMDHASEECRASLRAARAYMEEHFYKGYCRPQDATTVGIGHTHIDCAWLWTLKQTREKVQRSFSTVLELMDRYPEYRFMSSQPLLYQYLKEEAPEVYERVREKVREGRWECEGAMWVEADCNLPSGESLVRQLLYGKNFFRREFGVESRVLWLPDVFGYSAALPQILKKSGVEWLVTSKIGRNDTDRMPYDTFLWRGIDGTEILSYFLTAQDDCGGVTDNNGTYNGSTDATMISGTYKRYQQKELNDEALLTFGYGDGGGGPTYEQLELLRRGKNGISGVPNARIGFAGEFLDRLGDKIRDNPSLPGWSGELYLEFHRGTYTTQARNKKNNRRAEFLYADAEKFSFTAGKLTGLSYPAEELSRGWHSILTNQFHDIIPGSSIREVYEQCERDYEEIFEIGNAALFRAKEAIADGIAAGEGMVVFNPHSFCGDGFVKKDGITALVRDVAPTGYTVVKDFVTENAVKIEGNVVETDVLRVEFDANWQIVSLYDKKNNREVLSHGVVGNELRIYPDYTDKYDAWEWKEFSRDKYKTLTSFKSAEVVDDGARRGIRIVRQHMSSHITQTVWFCDGLLRVDFETHVDWQERHQMLKVAFPVDINADKASYEIQFGTLERPAHFNTSWDRARFEVCAHKFADISEGGYGVSLLNDCKYGYDIHDGVMQLSLLRGPVYPDPLADLGQHDFTYTLCPHNGTLAESDTVRNAYYLNDPMTLLPARGTATTLPKRYSAANVDCDHIILETIKAAENGDGTILRLYECKNMRAEAKLTLGFPAEKVWLCDLLENPIEELPVTNGTVTLRFRGFEILSLLVK
ncbi:MAG: alpha-mannosidase [Eubacteriales bacterium]